ncbi:MAG: endonuclease III [Calditerrivibrio sp.]|nr:endonuclease III [Calditerrivibrio sp.]
MEEIDKIFHILEVSYRNFNTPSVSQISQFIQNNPYAVLISTIISLRTKDAVTLEASKKILSKAKTPYEMVKLSKEEIEQCIYPAGFYRKKSDLIINISRHLIEKYNGTVPDSLEELLSIKGVGRKTANLVLVEGYGIPAICVDTHVHRIMNRMGFVNTRSPQKTEEELRKKLPKKYWIKWNEYLVAYGQNICKPILPICSSCKLDPFCAKKDVTKRR